nr:hypothetical protein CFP56_22506 [Quercus suber]
MFPFVMLSETTIHSQRVIPCALIAGLAMKSRTKAERNGQSIQYAELDNNQKRDHIELCRLQRVDSQSWSEYRLLGRYRGHVKVEPTTCGEVARGHLSTTADHYATNQQKGVRTTTPRPGSKTKPPSAELKQLISRSSGDACETVCHDRFRERSHQSMSWTAQKLETVASSHSRFA